MGLNNKKNQRAFALLHYAVDCSCLGDREFITPLEADEIQAINAELNSIFGDTPNE